MADRLIYVTTSVHTTDESAVPRVVEAFGRVVTGLALEGLDVNITVGVLDDEDESL